MNFAQCRTCTVIAALFFLVMMGRSLWAQEGATTGATIPPAAPNRLLNGAFECGEAGYTAAPIPPGDTKPNLFPNHWTVTSPGTIPIVTSALIRFAKACDQEADVEKIDGRDSVLIRALDHETPPEPGKPFDVTLHQQVNVISGVAYSLSGWMLTLCGGSNTKPRNDCPDGYYMAKLLGIDPTGGVDPAAPTVQWVENRRNFVGPDGKTRIGWQNLRLGVTAAAPVITVFARINSPFRWHGNHGFIDALSLVQAPTAALTVAPPASGTSALTLTWQGTLGPDIPLTDGSTHRLLYTVEYWHDANQRWRRVVEDAMDNGTTFTAGCLDSTYRFRIQARAEQPDGIPGAWPNQRYPGVWSAPVDIFVPAPPVEPGTPITVTDQLFLPLIEIQRTC